MNANQEDEGGIDVINILWSKSYAVVCSFFTACKKKAVCILAHTVVLFLRVSNV